MTNSIKQRTISLLAVTALATSAIGGVTLLNQQHASAASASTKQIKIDENTAVKKFKKKFKDTQIDEVQLQSNRGQYQYEVSGFDKDKEYSADINANTGKVVKTETERLGQKWWTFLRKLNGAVCSVSSWPMSPKCLHPKK